MRRLKSFLGGGVLRNNVHDVAASYRSSKLLRFVYAALSLLFLKLLISILYEYRNYFPANFDSAFLTGRQSLFVGSYRVAFYVHLISGPLAVVLGCCMMLSGGRSNYRQFHRLAGRLLILIVMLAVAPSGLVMALWAHAGPIAAVGFGLLSLGTALTAFTTIAQARARQFRSHQRWATRCFILLCSPLLLRLVSGALMVLQWDSEWTYRLNAWLSWLIPLAVYEVWWRLHSCGSVPTPLALPFVTSERAVP
jgi:uncharacterized membrane protein